MDRDLASLAVAYSIATEYYDQSGVHQSIEPETIEAVLAALGVDASTPEACRTALQERKLEHWRRTLPPAVVTRAGVAHDIWVHAPKGTSTRLRIDLEDGGRRHDLIQISSATAGTPVDGVEVSEFFYRLPVDLPLGWHTIVVDTAMGKSTSQLIVTPQRLALPAPLRERRGWGLAAQLYSVRSSRSWGLGDFEDLADLGEWSARHHGADFIQINPVHASGTIAPIENSPYLPASRRFMNAPYLRVESIPEYAYLEPHQRARVEDLAEQARAMNREDGLLDRERAWKLKSEALELVCAVPLTPGRQTDFEAYEQERGQSLEDFAIWSVLTELHGQEWDDWPDRYQDPTSPEVRAAALEHAKRVAYFKRLQWYLEEQASDAQRRCLDAGMALGVMHDLAIGVHPQGADTWALGDVLAADVSVGAPPDMYNQMGQNWSQPPWRPDALAEAGYLPYREVVRTALKHSGALRLDHVLGLFRLWWVPEGMAPSAGTYVRCDYEALVGILVLEAHRAGAVVVGEDLGTVETWVQDFLRERGILGTTILWFEEDQGAPLAPEHWREEALGAVSVHDLPPTSGYLQGSTVELRHSLGLLTRPVEEERAAHERQIRNWTDAMLAAGVIREGAGGPQLVAGLYRLLGRSPSRLLSLPLVDAVGDNIAQNQPGTSDEYPNWRMPLRDSHGATVLVDRPGALDGVGRLVAALGVGRGAR